MKQPDSDTSQDFSEVENKDQLKFRVNSIPLYIYQTGKARQVT
jgi:hypothetical protein